MKLICQRVGPGGNFTNHSGKLATQVYNAGINEIMGRTGRRSEKGLEISSKPVLFSINGLGQLLNHPFFKRKTQNIATIIVLLIGIFLKGCNDQMNEHHGVLCTLQHSTTAICLLTLMQYPCSVLTVNFNFT